MGFMHESQKIKDLRKQLEEQVHPNVEMLIKSAAERHTVLNLGCNWPEDTYYKLRSEAESDEVHEAIVDEYKSWLKDAKKEAAMVVKAKLPLTLNSMELAFMKKGPFEVKK
jgi:hypothetical protein